jgi:exonuclease SbcD
MRILHFADLHLGIETYGRIDPATGLNTRLLDFLRALDELVDYAIEQAIDLVLFCGDLYKGRDPSQTHQRALAERIRRLADAGIPIFLLAGNHDMPANPSRATTIDIFQTLLGASSNAYVHAVSEPGAYMIQTRDGPLQIVALPWPTPAQFPLPPWSPPETTDEMLLRIPAEASGFIADAAAKLDPSVPAILAAHIALGGAAVIPGSEQAMTLGLHPLFYPSQLHPELFD